MTENHTKTLVFTILDILQIKRIDDCESIYSLNPLYLGFDHVNGYIEKNDVNIFVIFDSTDENKKLLKKLNDVWNGIKNKIEEVSGNKYDYKRYYMEIIFNSDDDLPLNKPLKFHNMTTTIRSVSEDGKLYPQVHLDDALYELNV